MKKTASQIADQVLEKAATSRWREAIRSGLLSLREAEKLKKSMGVDPQREAAGLTKKWLGIAKRKGSIPLTRTGPQGNYVRADGSKSIPSNLQDALAPPTETAAYSFVNPVTKYKSLSPAEIKKTFGRHADDVAEALATKHPLLRAPSHTYVDPHFKGDILQGFLGKRPPSNPQFPVNTKELSRMSPRDREQLVGLMRSHEASELASTVKHPLISPQRGVDLGRQRKVHQHDSARVLLEEMRDSRMLSPRVQQMLKNLRSSPTDMLGVRYPEHRELGLLTSVVPPAAGTNRLYIPKHQVPKLTRKVTEVHRGLLTPPLTEGFSASPEFRRELLARMSQLR